VRIGKLAKQFGLSRGTLLHYDAIGLLEPSSRTDAGYREYTDGDVERLGRICGYRAAGVTLGDIRQLLDAAEPQGYVSILRRRLAELNSEMALLRNQQALIVRILKQHGVAEENEMLNKEQWVALLRATGLDDEAMHRWHREFEKMSGEAHEEFLVSLGIEAEEVKRIREDSRK
jgi:DNA-binding transcriptional MerR regulator